MDNEKTIKITNAKQFHCLVDLMTKNKEVARGFYSFQGSKEDLKTIWSDITDKLNSLGPPIRNMDGWSKVWNDYKGKIKKKLAHNKELVATGGSQTRLYNFSPLEESVINLLALEKAAAPKGKCFGLNESSMSSEPSQSNNSQIECEDEENITLNFLDYSVIRDATAPKVVDKAYQSTKNILKTEKLAYLNEHTEILNKLEANTKEIAHYCGKIYDLKAKKFKIYENYLNEKLKLRLEKNRLKIQIMEIEKERLALGTNSQAKI